MEGDPFIFWTVCLSIFFFAKIVNKCIYPDPDAFLESYGGYGCDLDGCKKIDTSFQPEKRYRRIDIQESKMSYKYCKIYNVSKGEWAHDVSGNDDPKMIWMTNEWDENDALVGFYSDNNTEFHNVIFCPAGYAVYVQADSDSDKAVYSVDDTEYRIPPAMLVNLNDAYDTEFVHSKNYPDEMDLESESEEESDDESDDESESEEESDDETMNNQTHIMAELEDNQPVIDFLCRCHDATDKRYKRAAYMKAIDEIKYYYEPIASQNHWNPHSIGPHIERKIREFLDGFPEDDIINS
jgi:hypothetical protein